MTQKQISVEKTLYAVVFLTALFLRMISLEKIPLGNLEAVNALQAFDIVSGNDYQVGVQPALVSLTSILFVFFESSNFFARLIPALCGSLLVLLPLLFKKFTGQKEALILAFFLALDPALIAVSRQAQGLILSVFFTILTAGMILNKKTIGGGICLALALLSGPQVISGILILLLTGLIWKKFFKGQFDFNEVQESENILDWKKLGFICAAVLVLVSTGFFFYPELITGFGNSLVAYFSGWRISQGTPFTFLLLALLVYETFLLFFSFAAALRNVVLKDPKIQFYSVWFFISLFVVLIYSERQIGDVVWCIIPLGLLAASQTIMISEFFNEEKLTFLGQSLLVLIIFLFVFNNLAGIFNNPLQGNVDWQIRLAGIIGGLVLVIALTVLMWWGWSGSIARNGLVWGIGAFLFILFLSAGWHSTGLGQSPQAELWFYSDYIQDADLLSDTIDSIAEWNMSAAGDPVIIVKNFESPSLRWELKDYQNLKFSSLVSVDASPDFIITPSNQVVEQIDSYTGQDFIWDVNPAWDLILPEEWINWALYKAAPLEKESIILWVRSELFPGYELNPTEN